MSKKEVAAKKPVKKSAGKSAAKKKSASNGASARPPRTGVGEYIRAQLKLKNPSSNQEIADAARAKFPGAKTTAASVSWYKVNG